MNKPSIATDRSLPNNPVLYTFEPEASESIAHHENWAISFIDLLMLLLTLFVLLLSFKNGGDMTMKPATSAKAVHQRITVDHKDTTKSVAQAASIPDHSPATPSETKSAATLKQQDMINGIVAKLNHDYIQEGVAHNEVQISATANSINLEISEAILFAPASDDLTAEGEQVLKKLAGSLVAYPFRLSVEGHTDNIQISSARFPSNWELSTSRANKVTRKLIDYGYPTASIRSIGYGDTQPLADNTTAEGRAKNRRVSITMDLPDTDNEY